MAEGPRANVVRVEIDKGVVWNGCWGSRLVGQVGRQLQHSDQLFLQ